MTRVLLVSADRSDATGDAINLGDALLTDALAASLEDHGLAVEVADFGGRRMSGPRMRRVLNGLRSLMIAVRDVDAVVLGGGTLLQDDRRDRLLGGLPRLMLVTATVARLFRRKVVFFGVGCDPIRRRVPRLMLGLALGSAPVWVRDESSRKRCFELFGRDVVLAGDASLLGITPMRALVADLGSRSGAVIALNGNDCGHLSEATMRLLRSEYGELTFLSMSQGAHLDDSSRIPSAIKDHFDRITEGLAWEEAVRIIGTSRLVIASRMHALYVATIVGTPAVAYGSSAKVRSFTQEFGIADLESSLRDLPRIEGGDRRRLDTAAARTSEGFTALVDYLLHE
jgi:polysaccharide pyruvyl transferase WcaK-like protein